MFSFVVSSDYSSALTNCRWRMKASPCKPHVSCTPVPKGAILMATDEQLNENTKGNLEWLPCVGYSSLSFSLSQSPYFFLVLIMPSLHSGHFLVSSGPLICHFCWRFCSTYYPLMWWGNPLTARVSRMLIELHVHSKNYCVPGVRPRSPILWRSRGWVSFHQWEIFTAIAIRVERTGFDSRCNGFFLCNV